MSFAPPMPWGMLTSPVELQVDLKPVTQEDGLQVASCPEEPG